MLKKTKKQNQKQNKTKKVKNTWHTLILSHITSPRYADLTSKNNERHWKSRYFNRFTIIRYAHKNMHLHVSATWEFSCRISSLILLSSSFICFFLSSLLLHSLSFLLSFFLYLCSGPIPLLLLSPFLSIVPLTLTDMSFFCNSHIHQILFPSPNIMFITRYFISNFQPTASYLRAFLIWM